MAVESDATASAAILLVCCAASNEANAEKWEQHKSGIAETKAIAKEGFIHGLPIAVSYPVTYE